MLSRLASWLRSLQLMNRLYFLAVMMLVFILRSGSRFITWFRSLEFIGRFYSLAFVIGIAGLIGVLISEDNAYFNNYALPLVSIFCGLGFALSIWPWICAIWQSPLGKFALAWISAGLWIMAQIFTRLLVAEALELPPQDFEVTVQVWTLLFYVPLWMLVVAGLLSVFVMVAFVIVGLLSLISSSLFIDQSLLKNRWKLLLDRFISRGFGHCMGGLVFLAIIGAGLDWFSSIERNLPPVIRLTAYYADFQAVPRYPGVDVTRRLRLHENGVVSYAEKDGWDVLISTEKIQPDG